MDHKNSDVCKHASGNREDIARRGTLIQCHQRVAIGRTRIYKDKQYIQRIEEPSSMMLSPHRRIIPSLKRSSRRFSYMSILDRFQIIQWFMQCMSKTTRTMHYGVSSSVYGEKALWKVVQTIMTVAGHCLHELRKQIKIHKLYVVMILKKLKWHSLILHNWKKSTQRHHRKSRD